MFVSQTKGWQNGIAWLLFEDDGKCEDNETEEGFAEGAGVAVVRVAIVGVDLASTLSHKLQCKQSTLHSIHHRLLLLGGHGVAGTAQLVIPVRPLGHFEEFLHAGGVEYGGAGGGLGAADRAAVLHQHRNLHKSHWKRHRLQYSQPDLCVAGAGDGRGPGGGGPRVPALHGGRAGHQRGDQHQHRGGQAGRLHCNTSLYTLSSGGQEPVRIDNTVMILNAIDLFQQYKVSELVLV